MRAILKNTDSQSPLRYSGLEGLRLDWEPLYFNQLPWWCYCQLSFKRDCVGTTHNILRFDASVDFWCDSIKPIFFSPLRIPVARSGGLASQLRASVQGSCCSQQCPWSLVQSWRDRTMEPGAIGGGAGPKEVKCFSQNVLTHDQETTRLVKTFPSLSSMIKRGAGSSAAKSPFCCWLEPWASEALWVNSPSRCCRPRSHYSSILLLCSEVAPQVGGNKLPSLFFFSFFFFGQRLLSGYALWFFRSHRLLAFNPLPAGYCLIPRACTKNQALKFLPVLTSPDQQISTAWTSTGMNFLYFIASWALPLLPRCSSFCSS